MTNTSKIRVRFAPSPTGYLHIGGLRTALYNYLFAKKHGGTFILRIEDTDQSRFVPGAIESLIQSLDETGLTPDEGVFLKKNHGSGIRDQETKESKSYPGIIESGDFGPYIQSERLDIYKQYADELIASGKAYHCFCSAERLTEVREAQAKNKQAPKYDKYCLSLAADERKQKVTSGVPCVIRLNVLEEHGDVVFADLVRGEVGIRTQDIDDQVLVKSDGFPTYHLANVVDDHLMRISHVIRAEEWLPSTPKHILLYEAFGWEMPQFAHIPLLLNPDKSKLSKRHGDVSVEEYLKKGYHKEARINFIALLGWNPGQGSVQEIFSLDELVQAFDLGHVHKAGAVFDLQKLDWMNAEYIKRVLSIERERLAKLSDIGENNPFFFAAELSYDTGLLHWKGNAPDMTREALTKSEKILSDLNDLEWSKKEILEKILLEAAGERKGDLLWPLRVALTGAERSPSPFEIAWVLGKEESLKRLENSIKRLS